MRNFWLCLIFVVTLSLGAPLLAQDEELRRALSSMKGGRFSEAEQILSRIEPENSRYAEAQACLGLLLLQRSAPAQAEIAFRKALDRRPDEPSARLGLGMALMLRGRPAEAAGQLEQVLSNDTVGVTANIQWIWSLILAGRMDRALEEVRRLGGTHPEVAEFQRLRGFLHQCRGEWKESLASYLECVRIDPANRQAISGLISVFQARKDWDSALVWAKRALELDPNQPVVWMELAAILEKAGRAEEARGARQESARTYEAETLYTRAARARKSGNAGEAERILRASIGRNPRLPKAWIDLGELLQAQGRFLDAGQAFRNALEFPGAEDRAALGLVTSLLSAGRDAEALRYCERFAADRTLTPDLLTAMASAFMKQGRTADAVAATLEATLRLPDDPDLLSYLGYVQQSGGKNREALESYAASLRFNPFQAVTMLERAQVLLSQGDTRGAIAGLRAALALDPGNTRILKSSIEAYRKAGDAESAELSCRACLQADPGDFECREQQASLRLDAGDYAGAARHFQLLVDSGRNSKSILDGLIFSLMKEGAFAPAIGTAHSSIRLHGPDPRVYATLGFLYRCTNDLPAAITHYRLARDMVPEDAERQEDYGYALYLAGNFKAAVIPLESALRLRPAWGAGAYNLAMVYWQLGLINAALQHARRAQELGVQEAAPIVRSLAAALAPPIPVTIRRAK